MGRSLRRRLGRFSAFRCFVLLVFSLCPVFRPFAPRILQRASPFLHSRAPRWHAAQQACVLARMAALCAPTVDLALRTSRRRRTPPGMAARRVQAAAKKREAPGVPSVTPLQLLFAQPGTKHLRTSLQALSQELLAAEPQPQSLDRCAWPLCALWERGVCGEQSPSFLNLPHNHSSYRPIPSPNARRTQPAVHHGSVRVPRALQHASGAGPVAGGLNACAG